MKSTQEDPLGKRTVTHCLLEGGMCKATASKEASDKRGREWKKKTSQRG